ncbi:Alg9-like mannosyltransferase [Botrytis cinerea]
MAFGEGSGAWITWEWHYQLRSSLHPTLFAAAYYLIDKPMEFVNFFPQFRAEVLAVLPNIIQAIFAAGCDYYTWKMAEKMYGLGSRTGYVTLLMSVLSPWNWFCSTRTFSNSLETSLTITALYFWPWDMAISSGEKIKEGKEEMSTTSIFKGVFRTTETVNHLRYSLLLAGIACILRPTNLLIWFCVIMPIIMSLIPGVSPKTTKSPIPQDYIILLREAILCGSIILIISAISDRLYFGEWTFPPYQWLHFNISQNLAVFYGKNDWHYFFSQGLPLLLLTYLPFTILSTFKSYTPSTMPNPEFTYNLQTILTHLTGVMIFVLSTISHKEVRFIYPLLPILLLLTAPSITSFFTRETQIPTNDSSKSKIETATIRKPLLTILILLNIALAAYTTIIHQSAVISVNTFIRHKYETEITPWRSQLVYKGLGAWALGCEPPVHLEMGQRDMYRDEADRFYDDPRRFLREEILIEGDGEGDGDGDEKKMWPRYLVGFEGVEKDVREFYEGVAEGAQDGAGRGKKMKEIWREKNTQWIDDWRRSGDVVVWEFV